MINPVQCKHYLRNCDKQAPCCKIFYGCRLCHDENYKGVKAEGCKVETMDRQSVNLIKCRLCATEQIPSNQCTNCEVQFAHYYCAICKFWDDDKKKTIYHCELCNMCRRGIKEENFHCETCDVCLSLVLKDNHKCQEKAFDQSCAVCQEYLKNSTKFIQQLDICKHWIHVNCLKQLLKYDNRCPVCNTAIVKMQPEHIEEIDKLVESSMKDIPEELKDKMVDIMCMECHKKSNTKFHFYLKCGHCGSYNTKE